MTEKMPQQESHAPLGALGEEVDESLHPLLQAIVDNIKLIVGVIGALILIVGGYAVFDSVQGSRLADSRTELASLIATQDPAQRAKALEEFDAPSGLSTAVQLELAGALAAAGEHERAAAIWGQLSDVDTADLGLVASLGQAAELGKSGKYAEAAAVLAGLRDSIPEGYKALVLHRLAYASEHSGDWETSLSCWEELQTSNQSADNGFITGKIKTAKAKLEKSS
ncbi:hypothetical protein [Desulfovibrio ferrophilus]|uniref:Tetratricopeptide repeat-like domain-containing protein n=1 Tax=Desulfovibrio ferrophilus TaxID=241368 RepID=A0A2Z6AUL7_9BACT|nr:hypothetical protein [Desulfovibrio ferrophilus]BBD06932.1 uncharacterized protein DFE_0206 [Desulfovibrio ferrophilus]